MEGQKGGVLDPETRAKSSRKQGEEGKGMRSQAQGGGRHGTRGITLIEILIIIAILGVLAAVCGPSLVRLLGQ